MPPPEKVNVALPEDVNRQFAALRRRLFSVESIFAISLALSAILLSFFVVFISDRFIDTPPVARLICLVAALCAIAGIAFRWARLWLFQPRDLRALSQLVQKKYHRLGDRLLGIVELADEARRPAYFSAELYEAAISQVSAESAPCDFSAAVDPKPTRLQLWITGGLLLLVLLPLLVVPKAGWNALCRWLSPLGGIPRFTLVELEDLPGEQIIPHGEKFTISGSAKFKSFWHPHWVKAEIAGQPEIVASAEHGAFTMEIPGQVRDSALTVKFGDTSAQIRLKPRQRPGIQSARAEIELPDYLKYPHQQVSALAGILNVLEGSKLSIKAVTSRDLKAAFVSFNEKPRESLPVSHTNFATSFFPIGGVSRVEFSWRDELGLTNGLPWRLNLQTQKDAPPLPEIPDLYRDTAILETEVLPIAARASDDYGVKTLGLSWVVDNADALTNAPIQKEFVLQSSTNNARVIDQTFNFSPAVLRIPAETTVSIQAFSTDFFPGRERAETPIYRIHVLGNARHAEMIRQNLESLLAHLEDVSRLEEKIASETREMKELQKLDTPESADKAAELEQEQEKNAANLQEIASEGMKTLREALRNPAFSEQMLTKWTRDMHKMRQLAENQMKDAATSLKQASQPSKEGAAPQPAPGDQASAQPSKTARDREQKLGEALKKEQEIVQSLQQMQKTVNAGLDDLQALTLAQRLRQLGESEKKIEGHLQSAISDTIGLTPQELPLRYQKANNQLAGMQNETQTTSTKLQGEISRFYERTQKPNYGQVSKEMQYSRASDQLEHLRGLIQENIGMEAMQNLGTWADRFSGWADKLEPKGEEGGSGSGSGQSGPQQKDDSALKQLLSLLRIREKQLNIQERTRLLDQYTGEKIDYQDGAILLAASQEKLHRDLSKQAADNHFAILEAPYNDTLTSMNTVESLLDKPRTDEVTREAQDKSLANITDLINLLNEEAKKNNNSSSSASSSESSSEQMAFLMQMMAPQIKPGMQSGQRPGANMNGGTTDRAAGPITGDSSGKSGESRSVKQSSGLPENYPTEFRQALENYFKAIEQKGSK
jgi:hypothetical protein